MMSTTSVENADKGNSELLSEAQRTTHAVRAIARFIILQVTYSVVGALLVALGTIALTVRDGGSLAGILILGGAGTIIAGLIHSLQAGWDELGRSNRLAPPVKPVADRLLEQEEPHKAVFKLVEGACECSKWERGFGNTGLHEGLEYCLRCNKALKK
jgi:hypothetical protein